MFGYLNLVEKRIQEALERGDFDNLPGKGKPIPLEDDSMIPEDLRLAYKILKNAGCLPPEIEHQKEIRRMEDLLKDIPDEKERYGLMKRINFQILKLNMTGRRSPLLEKQELYYGKVIEKLAQKK